MSSLLGFISSVSLMSVKNLKTQKQKATLNILLIVLTITYFLAIDFHHLIFYILYQAILA